MPEPCKVSALQPPPQLPNHRRMPAGCPHQCFHAITVHLPTGPIMSLVNFFQSADLFKHLNLHWPPAFKAFIQGFAQYL